MTGSVIKTVFPTEAADYRFDLGGLGSVEVWRHLNQCSRSIAPTPPPKFDAFSEPPRRGRRDPCSAASARMPLQRSVLRHHNAGLTKLVGRLKEHTGPLRL
jgi:hypothetical protein